VTTHVTTAHDLGELAVHAGHAGLVLGLNRQRRPTTARLFRPEPTRVTLIGGPRCAQLLAFRAFAIGAVVVIQSARPAAWEAFVRGVSAPTDMIGFAPPGSMPPRPATAFRPELVIVDVGPTVGDLPLPGGSWRATLVLRDELTAWDVDSLVRADLALFQPLTDIEAALAVAVPGLADVREWLIRIRADMITVASNGSVRWAQLSPTGTERALIGSPSRF